MKRCLLALALVLLPTLAGAQSYTLSPSPFLLVQTNSGAIINGGCVWTYVAGTTTAAATYSDNAGTPNTNPIKADSAGRFTAYLQTGSSYKFVYENTPCTVSPPLHGATLRTQDNIQAVPATAGSIDVVGTAGENLNARAIVYLSDGSGSKTAGQWYNADATNTYSSLSPELGMTPSACSSGSTQCAVRVVGTVTGFSTTPGVVFYLSTTPGILTTTPPAHRRAAGITDSATSFALPPPQPFQQPWTNQLRVTLTTATPVTASDVTAATTLYLTPYTGNRIDLPSADTNGFPVNMVTSEVSIAVPATTNTMYDVFAYDNAGVLTLELTAWTNDTTRATALLRSSWGVWVKTGATTRLYVGSFRTTAVSGQTENSKARRLLWNYWNRLPAELGRKETTASWDWLTAAWHQANAAAANQVDFVLGLQETLIDATVLGVATQNTLVVLNAAVALGLDSTTVPSGVWQGVGVWDNGGTSGAANVLGVYKGLPAVGYHYLAWLEYGNTSSMKYYGTGSPGDSGGGADPAVQTGISGWLLN